MRISDWSSDVCSSDLDAIRTMRVRGAPLIGATAAYGVALAMREDPSDENLEYACRTLMATRPTAVNLRWALDDMRARLLNQPRDMRMGIACARAAPVCDEDEIGRAHV